MVSACMCTLCVHYKSYSECEIPFIICLKASYLVCKLSKFGDEFDFVQLISIKIRLHGYS